MRYIIFTDLDGTLLDSETYEFSEALSSIDLIKKKGYPLIIVTSKTRSEVLPILKELEINFPFVVENGGGVFFFKANLDLFSEKLDLIDNFYVKIFGKTYDKIRNIFGKLKEMAPLLGFGDMDDKTIAELTQLPIEQVKNAKKREFSEPFIFEKDEDLFLGKVIDMSSKYNTKVLKGGRFYHLVGAEQDKGKSVKYLISLFERLYGNVISIGLGDSKNDVDFLKVVDIPIVIRRKNGSFLDVKLENKIVSDLPETRGWNEVLLEVLK